MLCFVAVDNTFLGVYNFKKENILIKQRRDIYEKR